MMGDVDVLIPAAGSGSRFGRSRNKLFEPLRGRPIWRWTVDQFLGRDDVRMIYLAVSKTDHAIFEREIGGMSDRVALVPGGAERTDSVRNMVDAARVDGTRVDATRIDDAADGDPLLAIHDAARPLVTSADLDAVFAAARDGGAALLASAVTSSLHRRVDGGCVAMDRNEIFEAATPQVFRLSILSDAYDRHRGRPATDDATLVSRAGYAVRIVPGRRDNLKITTPEDLAIASALLSRRESETG